MKQIGFSLWVDFLERDFLDAEFKQLLHDGVINGATSNPSIFRQSILTSNAYAAERSTLKGRSAKGAYEAMAFSDIKKAAKILRPQYECGNDGFVSIEIDPFLANDSRKSIEEGMRLWETIDEPNVMIKVPATQAGYSVMTELLSREIPVNATLIFSPQQAKSVCEAVHKADPKRAHAVISVFVSRFDRKLEAKLSGSEFENRVGIMNAANIYNIIDSLKPPRTRCLFASTGVKGNTLPADYYIKELLAPNSINTAPLDTIKAYILGGTYGKPKLPIAQSKIDEFFDALSKKGVLMQSVYDELIEEGLLQFEAAFGEILRALEA